MGKSEGTGTILEEYRIIYEIQKLQLSSHRGSQDVGSQAYTYPPPPIPKQKAEDTSQENLPRFKNHPMRSSYSWQVPLTSSELSISIQVHP